jgi:hypothetical protein
VVQPCDDEEDSALRRTQPAGSRWLARLARSLCTAQLSFSASFLALSSCAGAASDSLSLAIDFEEGMRPTCGDLLAPISGSASAGVPGKFGRAVRIDPDTQMDIALRSRLGAAGKLQVWLRVRERVAPGTVGRILAIRADTSQRLWLNHDASGRLRAGLVHGKQRELFKSDANALRAGEWQELSLLWDEAGIRILVDGRVVAGSAHRPAFEDADFLRFVGSAFDVDALRISRAGTQGGCQQAAGVPIPVPAPADAYRFAAGLSIPGELHVQAWDLGQEIDPSSPPTLHSGTELLLSSAPGEKVVGAVLIVAGRNQQDVRVSVGPLHNGSGASIDPDAWKTDFVARTPQRRIWNADASELSIRGRLLLSWRPTDLQRGEFRELWVGTPLARDQAPGDYRGTIVVRSEGVSRELPIRLRVHPIRLIDSPGKRLGIYYLLAKRLVHTELARRELADIRAHGARNLITDLSIRWQLVGGAPRPSKDVLRRGLELIREAGFDGSVVVGTGLADLARQLGYARDKAAPGIDSDPKLAEAGRLAAEILRSIDRDFRGIELLATHLDEVFNKPQRLQRYIALSKHFRRTPSVPLYITLSTRSERFDSLRARLDPWVDVRGNHGYSFEWWLRRGHSMNEYEQELARSGDRAWLYHNARGVHFPRSYPRIINGLYLWASPFECHAPWVYQSYRGNPFDDTDGTSTDYGMALPTPDGQLVSTVIWESMREGGVDLRYLSTLEAAIEQHRSSHPDRARDAAAFLDRLRNMIRTAKPSSGRRPGRTAALGAEQPLLMHRDRGLENEAPLIRSLADRLNSAEWNELRDQIASHISALNSAQSSAGRIPKTASISSAGNAYSLSFALDP